jgi:hypothetical protein
MLVGRLGSLHVEEGPASPQADGNRQVSVGHERPSCGVVHGCILPHVSPFCKAGNSRPGSGGPACREDLQRASLNGNQSHIPVIGLSSVGRRPRWRLGLRGAERHAPNACAGLRGLTHPEKSLILPAAVGWLPPAQGSHGAKRTRFREELTSCQTRFE